MANSNRHRMKNYCTDFASKKIESREKINVKIIVILHEELHFRIPFTMFKGSLMDRKLDLERQETE